MQDAPCAPINCVRGDAMKVGSINETFADPFCGFSLGSGSRDLRAWWRPLNDELWAGLKCGLFRGIIPGGRQACHLPGVQ